MSLDVYLKVNGLRRSEEPCPHIFVRENGQTREISREEWDQRNPGLEPVTWTGSYGEDGVYHDNITHNMSRMADAAGVYDACWRAEEIGITKAHQLVPLLREDLEKLKSDPTYFKTFNPANGWGNYEVFVRFVEKYLAACEEYPDADVQVSR